MFKSVKNLEENFAFKLCYVVYAEVIIQK